ncbi:MAG: hypothetical protein QM770_11365 [Tepidisphaeraceae bacterium]
MPITVNGIGTRFVGMRNATSRPGLCQQCNRGATLTSYDTTHFIVVFFIPIIPLGMKRIVDQCSSCRRMYVVDQHKFEVGRMNDYTRAEQLVAGNRSEQDVIDALGLVVQYRDPFRINDTIARALRARPTSPKVHLVVSDVHRFVGQYDEAVTSLRRSLDLQEDPAVREELARLQVALGQVDVGRQTLKPLTDGPAAATQARGTQLLIAQGLQREGRHREALEALNRISIVDVSAAQQRDLEKMRKFSESELMRAQSDPHKYMSDPSGDVLLRKPMSRRRKGQVVALALVAVLVAYLGACAWLGQYQKAYLVNGTSRAYQVDIGGRRYALQPHETQTIRVAQGVIPMKIVDPAYIGGPATATYRTNFLGRLFNSDVFVLNPDGQALIFRETVIYTRTGGGHGPEPEQFVGQVSYVVPSVQYPFVNPPASMKMSTSEMSVTTLYTDTAAKAIDVIQRAADKDPSTLRAVAQHVSEWTLDGSNGSMYALALLPKDEALATLEKQILLRPIVTHAHRMYQEIAKRKASGIDVVAKYKAMLEAEPENRSLMYLYGRALSDPDQAMEWYRKAERLPNPEPMAYIAEAYHLAAVGKWHDAGIAIDAAKDFESVSESWLQMRWNILLAAHRYDEAADFEKRLTAGDPLEHLFARMHLAALRGTSLVPFDQELNQFLKKFENADPASLASVKARYAALKAYLNGSEPGYAAAIKAVPALATDFQAALASHDVAAAAAVLEKQSENVAAESQLLVYLLARCEQNLPAADRALKAAMAALEKGDVEERQLADWLAGRSLPTEAQLVSWPATPSTKCIAMSALGVQSIALRPICFKLAAEFDFERTPPHLLLERVRTRAGLR